MKTTTQKIVCIHLFNNYSGSPLVFSQAIKSLLQAGSTIDLYTNNHQGFLSEIEGIHLHVIPYQWCNNRWLTLFYYLYAQLWLFIKLHKYWYWKEHVTFYINTVLPFGAALAAALMGKRIIYHIHESSVKPQMLKRFLFGVASYTATDAIYVSDYLLTTEQMSQVMCHRVHNVLPIDFSRQAEMHQTKVLGPTFSVLMLCSLKVYKGVLEYVSLAHQMPDIKFSLVLNATWEDIQLFFSREAKWPENLMVYPYQQDVHSFYQKANLVLNLSAPKQWVETFGMTILEGMAYGLPAIIPPIGGVTELVEDGVNGYHIDPKNGLKLQKAIRQLANDSRLYKQFQQKARNRGKQFSRLHFCEQVNQIVLDDLKIRNSSQMGIQEVTI